MCMCVYASIIRRRMWQTLAEVTMNAHTRTHTEIHNLVPVVQSTEPVLTKERLSV